MTKFIEEENKLLNVCVLDETSRFYNVPNSKELIEEIKQQMETHIEIQKNYVINGNTVLGSYDLPDIFSTYDNPRIVDNQLYIDLKLLNTLLSKRLIDIIKIYEGEICPIKFGLSMIAEVKEDGSIINPELICINLLPNYKSHWKVKND